jgi:RNA polymerase sigma-54 factor
MMAHQLGHTPYHKPSHRPMTTAHLAQTMTLLEMNNHELAERIQGELASNPALELDSEKRCPACGRKLVNQICSTCSRPESFDPQAPVVFVSPQQRYSPRRKYTANGDEIASFEEFSPQEEDLAMFVLSQMRTELEPRERPIAAHILTSLNEDGLLPITLSEIALYHHVPISTIQHVKELIQKCDPLGVGSQSPQEALMVQAEALHQTEHFPELALRAIELGFQELTQKNYRALAKAIGSTTKQAEQIAKYIGQNLNPFPGRSYWGSHRSPTNDAPDRYQSPDVIISILGDQKDPQLVVEVLWPIYAPLKINPDFRKAIADAPPEKNSAWNDDYQKANLLIKCLGQRNHTLVQLMEQLAMKQREFILNGDMYMVPLTRAQLAEELGVHESTISRAVSSKSVQLPSGKIVPIALFFDRSLHIRTVIKEIIADEEKPLSDTRITTILEKSGYNVARRTVAKYRSMEGILPAHLRAKAKA